MTDEGPAAPDPKTSPTKEKEANADNKAATASPKPAEAPAPATDQQEQQQQQPQKEQQPQQEQQQQQQPQEQQQQQQQQQQQEKKQEEKQDKQQQPEQTKEAQQKETEAAKPTEDAAAPPEEGSKFQGLNARLAFAISAAAFGSAFQHGYNLGVINNPQSLIEAWINSTYSDRHDEPISDQKKTFVFSVIVSIYCAGGMIGGAMTGFFAERFGRKGGLLINNAFALLAAVLFGFCKMASSYEMLIAGRFVIGINNGLNAGLCPMYLSEIAPTNLRGAIGTAYQLVLTISILLSQIMGLENLLGTEALWPLALALTGAPAIFQLIALPVCPESPKFLLISKDKPVDAQRALTWLRNTNDVQTEMGEMRNEAEAGKLVPAVSLREIVMNPTLRIPLVISLMMMMAQQLSGINAVIFFSTEIYKTAGLTDDAALNATIAMGTMNVLMTFASLVMVEKFGRKTLMLVGLGGMLVDVFLLFICLLYKDAHTAVGYFSIVLVILFVVMFATGPGSIPWFFVTELFAQNARPTASSIAVAVNWTAAFFVGIGFLPLKEVMGPYVFIIFVVLLTGFIIFTWFKVPETKGRSIDEITSIFKQTAYGDSRV